MCGIAGIIASNAIKYENNIHNMVKSIHHRGPDGRGFHIDDNSCLGHARLSIIDIEHGQQPIISNSTNNVIILNGEIYGYKEIRNKLKEEYNFKTHTDTEVVLALYDIYKHNLMSKVPGMFSFAIWDADNKTLFAARDRFGEKPFYYAIGRNGEFIFASEIKSIIASNLVDPIIDKDVAASFLRTMYVNPNTTIYKNIYSLSPAHQLIYNLEEKSPKISRYWSLPIINNQISADEATEEFLYLFKNAVKKQMVADVEVSAFLSGGLDSSSVVSVASQLNDNLRTISFGFSDKNACDVQNELPYSSAVAKMYNTNHLSIEDKNTNFADLFLKMIDIYDEPFGDSSSIPTYLISKEAAKHTKVVLTGDGADELLAGYSFIYRTLFSMEKQKEQRKNLFSNIKNYITYKTLKRKKRLLKNLGKNTYELDSKIQNLSFFKAKTINISNHHTKLRYSQSFNKYLEKIGIDDINKSQNKDYEETYKLLNLKMGDPDIGLNEMLQIDLCDYMAGDILVKVDRATMANSLESRAPFLDVDLASFCLTLPYQLKIDDNCDKVVMRNALQNQWPEIIKKRPKHGFGSPTAKLLESKEFKDLFDQYFYNNNPLFNIISYKETKNLISNQNYNNINKKSPQFLWNLLNLAVWCDKKSFAIS